MNHTRFNSTNVAISKSNFTNKIISKNGKASLSIQGKTKKSKNTNDDDISNSCIGLYGYVTRHNAKLEHSIKNIASDGESSSLISNDLTVKKNRELAPNMISKSFPSFLSTSKNKKKYAGVEESETERGYIVRKQKCCYEDKEKNYHLQQSIPNQFSIKKNTPPRQVRTSEIKELDKQIPIAKNLWHRMNRTKLFEIHMPTGKENEKKTPQKEMSSIEPATTPKITTKILTVDKCSNLVTPTVSLEEYNKLSCFIEDGTATQGITTIPLVGIQSFSQTKNSNFNEAKKSMKNHSKQPTCNKQKDTKGGINSQDAVKTKPTFESVPNLTAVATYPTHKKRKNNTRQRCSDEPNISTCFPELVHKMVTEVAHSHPDILNWIENGEAFIIHNKVSLLSCQLSSELSQEYTS